MSRILKLLAMAAGIPADRVREIVNRGGDSDPALRALADQLIAVLDGSITDENIEAVRAALPQELSDIAEFIFRPEDHPSDFGG